MTHSLYLSIIGAVVFFAAYIILRLLRDNERLMLELDEAKAEARTLDADLDEARRSNREAVRVAKNVRMQYKAHRVKHNAAMIDLDKKITKFINQKDKAEESANSYKVRFEAVAKENEKANDIIQSQRKQLVLKAKESQKNKYSITQLNSQLNVMSESVAEYNNEAKAWKIKFNALDAEHRKTIQHLYGRIGAMQRKINKLKSLP